MSVYYTLMHYERKFNYFLCLSFWIVEEKRVGNEVFLKFIKLNSRQKRNQFQWNNHQRQLSSSSLKKSLNSLSADEMKNISKKYLSVKQIELQSIRDLQRDQIGSQWFHENKFAVIVSVYKRVSLWACSIISAVRWERNKVFLKSFLLCDF